MSAEATTARTRAQEVCKQVNQAMGTTGKYEGDASADGQEYPAFYWNDELRHGFTDLDVLPNGNITIKVNLPVGGKEPERANTPTDRAVSSEEALVSSQPNAEVVPTTLSQERSDRDGIEPEESALSSLLKHARVYELAGAPIPHSLLLYGVVGSAVMLLTGLFALVLPAPEAIHHSSFFWFMKSPAASVVSWMQAIAIPSVIIGLLMLLVDHYVASGRRSEFWRGVIVTQSVVGTISGLVCALFLALVLFILVVYILIGVAIFATICLALFVR